jgi:hypothetical protein
MGIKEVKDHLIEVYVVEKIEVPLDKILDQANPEEVIKFLNFEIEDLELVIIGAKVETKVDLSVVLNDLYNNLSEEEISKIIEYCKKKT